MPMFRATVFVSAALVLACIAQASETDQFMTWNVELSDSGPILNDYVNRAAQEYVDKRNKSNAKIRTLGDMASGFYLYLFEGIYSSRIRRFIWETPEIDRFPSHDTSFWAFQRESIYHGLSFPYIMPMARTIRVGDVYFGIDKVCHFFGFGRRYYQRYTRLLSEGMDDEQATDHIIKNGLEQESNFVGGLVDGVMSRADLEANYQGFMMLRELTDDAHPFFVKDNGQWKVNGKIDFTKYVTPGFDESYNISYYTYFRWRKVGPELRDKYCSDPQVAEKLKARFAQYEACKPSRFLQYLDREYEATGKAKFKKLTLDDLCERETNANYAHNK